MDNPMSFLGLNSSPWCPKLRMAVTNGYDHELSVEKPISRYRITDFTV